MFKLSALIALFTALAACSASNSLETTAPTHPQRPQAQSPDKEAGEKPILGPVLTLNTVMTDEGVECPAIRGDDGTLYTVPTMPRNFNRGDRLNIIIADPILPVASFCQQGQTIDWLRIEWVSASGEILETWNK